MKIEINKTYSLGQLISALAGLCVIVPMVYYVMQSDYQRATFYGVVYLAILIERVREDLRCDCEECEDDDTSN
jgi:hypothetical protein